MKIEDIEQQLRGLRPRGAPAEFRDQIVGRRAPAGRRFVVIGALAAVWLVVGLSHLGGLRVDERLSAGRAPLDTVPPLSEAVELPILAAVQNNKPMTP